MKTLLSKLFASENNIAGLDIGSSSIKFMEIAGNDLEDIQIVNYAIEPIPEELMAQNGKFENLQAIAELIRKCWKKSGSSVKNVTIALPAASIIGKKAILPSYELESDLQLQVEAEIGRNLPEGISVEDIALDYYTMGPSLHNAGENDMLLVATKKEKIDERIALVELAGLVPTIVDVEQYAVQNLVRLMKSDEFMTGTFVVVDCSGHMLRLLAFRKGELVYTKDASTGGMELSYQIMNNLNISFGEAEKMKIERSGDETYDMIEKTFLNNYCSEFIRAFNYFTSATSVSEIDEVILTGGMACIPGFETTLQAALMENNEVLIKNKLSIARPLVDCEKSSKISLNKFSRDEPSLFMVSSLALRRFLRPY